MGAAAAFTALRVIVALVPFANIALVAGYNLHGHVQPPPSGLISSYPLRGDSCGGNYNETEGFFTSPNYPNDYPANADCQWVVTSYENTKIKVIIEEMHTYYYDTLQIRDGNTSNAAILFDHYGDYIDKEVTSSSNSLFFSFYSDDSTQMSGFELRWFAGWDARCNYCDNFPGTDIYDPLCGQDNYSGHSIHRLPASCYTNVHYDGSHRVERGWTENFIEDGSCFDSGFAISCFCSGIYHCNSDLCQHCNIPTSPADSTTTQPLTISTTHPSNNVTTNPSIISNTPSTTATFTTPFPVSTNTPSGQLNCYSCISCNVINEDTDVESSEDFLSCFTAITLEGEHFVLRGGSPDYYDDGLCRHEADGVFVCYCTSDRCNSDAAAADLLWHIPS